MSHCVPDNCYCWIYSLQVSIQSCTYMYIHIHVHVPVVSQNGLSTSPSSTIIIGCQPTPLSEPYSNIKCTARGPLCEESISPCLYLEKTYMYITLCILNLCECVCFSKLLDWVFVILIATS